MGSSGVVTLVEGSSFCISTSSGDFFAGMPHGLFFRDTRFLSRFELRVNHRPPEPLAASPIDPFSAVFVARGHPRAGRADSTLMIFRYRYVGRGMREDIVVRNFGEEPSYCSVELTLEADFAHLFEVKEGRVARSGEHSSEVVDGSLIFRWRKGAVRRGVRVTCQPKPQFSGNQLTYEVIVPARGEWRACLQLTPVIDGDDVEPRYRCGEPVERAMPAERLKKWRRDVPLLETDDEDLRMVVTRSLEDLGALRIFDPDHPERAVVAAGAPWFMTLFGRDSLLTSQMALLVDPDLALGTLQTLARFQGTDVDPRTEEEPGRILHEMRFGEAASLSLEGGAVYYGTADATPLFVMLLGELRRWGLAKEVVDQLLPHADAAMDWIVDFGDRDGDGYVEYQRSSDRGLENQGWKDSFDGIRFANGDLPRTPIALCEVQGYVYGAYLARAHFAEEMGDMATALRWRHRAVDLKRRFNEDFWLEERGLVRHGPRRRQAADRRARLQHGALPVDRHRRRGQGRDSSAERLLSPDMFSGWGVRTLASAMTGYNPISYHCGSVWPHDNAIIAAGLMRYGMVERGPSRGHRRARRRGRPAAVASPSSTAASTAPSSRRWSATRRRARHRHGPRGVRCSSCGPCCDSTHGCRTGRSGWRPCCRPAWARCRCGGSRSPAAGSRSRSRPTGRAPSRDCPPEIQLVTEPRHPLTAG